MPAFKVGDRMCHPDHGEGTVTFVGEKYDGIEFDEKGNALLRMDGLDSAARSAGRISSSPSARKELVATIRSASATNDLVAVWRSERNRVIMFSLLFRISDRSSQLPSAEGFR